MKIIILFLVTLTLLSGCLSVDKAKKFMRSHAQDESELCALDYPVKASIVVVDKTDTLHEKMTEDELTRFADSIVHANVVIDNHAGFYDAIAKLEHENAFNKATADALRAEIKGTKPVDTVSLKKSIEAKIRATISPCHDSLVTVTQESTAAVSALRSQKEDISRQLSQKTVVSDRWKKWCLICGAIALFFIILTIIKFIK